MQIRGTEEASSSGSCWTEYSNKLFFRMNEEMIQIQLHWKTSMSKISLKCKLHYYCLFLLCTYKYIIIMQVLRK